MKKTENKYINQLGDFVKNKEKFYDLDETIQTNIFSFLKANRLVKLKLEKIRNRTIEIENTKKDIKKLSKDITKYHKIIKDIPSGYMLSELSIEKDSNSYMLVINWVGLRKKCSLGTDLKKIELLCKRYHINKKIKLNQSNFKSIIRESLHEVFNDFLVDVGFKKIKEAKKIKIDWERGGFVVIQNEGINLDKADKWIGSKKLGQNVNTPTSLKKSNRNSEKFYTWPKGNLSNSLNH